MALTARDGNRRPPGAVGSFMPSKVIRKLEYDPVEHRLDVVFTSGRHYRYHEVPEELFAAMRRAFSKGEFFNAHVRDHFRCTRVS